MATTQVSLYVFSSRYFSRKKCGDYCRCTFSRKNGDTKSVDGPFKMETPSQPQQEALATWREVGVKTWCRAGGPQPQLGAVNKLIEKVERSVPRGYQAMSSAAMAARMVSLSETARRQACEADAKTNGCMFR